MLVHHKKKNIEKIASHMENTNLNFYRIIRLKEKTSKPITPNKSYDHLH